jgi:hypothetical protein
MRPKEARQMKIKIKSKRIIFFDSKGIGNKEFVLQATQSISHATVTFYGDCVKMCEDFAPNFGDK